MPSNFPGGPDTITNNVSNSTPELDTHPNIHNQLADAVMAVENSLLPGGSLHPLTLPLTQTLTFNPDNTYDIGASAASRPRNIYAATAFIGPGALLTGGTAGQVLAKNSATNYDSAWVSPFSQALADARYLQLSGGTLTGGLLFSADNTFDIGAAAATRPRTIYAATSVETPILRNTSAVNTNILEQRNGTNPQVLRLYNTYTDASNYERFDMGWGVDFANRFSLMIGNAGTGSVRDMQIGVRGANFLYFMTNNNVRWHVHSAGNFNAQTDNLYDIGASGSFRPRNGFFAGAVATGVKAGAAIDGDVNTPTDGMIRIDSTNGRIYARYGGAWHYAALT